MEIKMTKDSDVKTSKQNGTTKRKRWWKRRSKLEKKLIILLGISILLLAGFIMFVTVKFIEKRLPCETPGCIIAASQIVRHIDTTVDPCDDFFKFTCGTFIEHSHGDLKTASIKEMEEQIERELSELIQQPVSDDDHDVIKIQKDFFQCCMNETMVEEEALNLFKGLWKEINGWQVLTGPKWNYKSFNWIDFQNKLRERGFTATMLLDVDVMPDPLDKNKYLVYISEPYVKKIKNEYQELYKNYMIEVAVKFGAKKDDAELEMDNVLDFMEKLRKVAELNDFDTENGNETERNITAEMISTRYTVEEFQIQNDQIEWLDYINNILYPAASINSSDYAIFPKTEFVEEFFTLMRKTPKKILANYMMWDLLELMMPFFPKEYKQLREIYDCQTDASSSSKDRLQFCKTMIKRSFYPLPTNIIYARNYLPFEKREKVQEILRYVRTEFVTILHETSWMDKESREKAVEKANSMSEIIGAPGDYLQDSVFDIFDPFETPQEDNDNGTFSEMYLNYNKHRINTIFSRINKPANESDLKIFYQLLTKVNAMYSPEDNALILPVGILQGIFFGLDRPMYLNYGALGSIMGHELTHGFCKDASQFDKDGNKGNMWTNETARAYEEKTQCIIQAAEDFDVEDTENTINGTLTMEENIADFTGLKVAYAAYKKWVKDNGPESPLTGVNYNPYQLFWISSILHECYELSGEKLEKSLENDFHALNSFRATGPLRNNPDFAIDFNCPAGSKMNPSEKCQVF